jgi:hypothetical protein
MAKQPQVDEGSLYGRVLQRLALALQEAERTSKDGAPSELEVRGLTPAEFELIRAYLQQDKRWLSGWHAAAEEQAHISRRVGRPVLRNVLRHSAPRKAAVQELQQALSCALCNAPVSWPEGAGPAVCSACGSQLLRARQRLHIHSRH